MSDHARVKAVFAAVRQRPIAERQPALAGLCGDDLALRTQVEALLAQDDRPDAPLDHAVLGGRLDLEAVRDGERDPALPVEIGGHRILARLGDGGMGVVYLARQEPPGREVALKVLRSVAPTPEQIARLRREAALLARLQHAGIAQIFEVGEHAFELGGQPFLVLELVRGQPLLAYALACELSVPERTALLASVCAAVGHAHAQGVVHRDLKPSHVLVDREGRPRVIDFGIAKALGSSSDDLPATRAGSLLGTPQYASPEQLRGGEVGPASDVYSLGLMLFELLAGCPPYRVDQGQPAQALRTVCDVPVDPSPLVRAGVDRELRTVVLRALEKTPARRYDDAAAFGADLLRHLAGARVQAREPGPLARGLRWSRRRPRGAAMGLALASVALAFLGFAWRQIEDARGHAARASESWQAGDLAAARHSLLQVPTWAERWLAAPLRARGSDLRALSGEDPLVRVVATLEGEDPAAARLLAGRYLERDGAAAHAELLRFLVAGLRDDEARSHALRLCARAWFERPDDAPAAVLASEPLRAALEQFDRERLVHADRLQVLVALGGCGVPRDLDLIRRWCDAAVAAAMPGGEVVEEIRSCMTTFAGIARRALACGYAAEWLPHGPDLALTSLSQAYAAPDLAGGNRGEYRAAFGCAWIADAYARRWANAPPSRAPCPPDVLSGRLRAVRRDQEYSRLLEANPAALLASVTNHGDADFRLQLTAYALEALGIRARRPEVDAVALDAARSYRLPGKLAAEFYAAGVRAAVDAAAGRRGDFDPDADTHLGAWFEVCAEPLASVVLIVEPAPPGGIARWRVGEDGMRIAGAATSAAWRNVRVMRDELEVDAWHAVLGPVGAAEIVLEFDRPDGDALESAVVEVQAIKSKRAYLPYFGQALLMVEVDGARVAHLQIDTTSWDPLRWPVSLDRLGPGPHRLRLSLGPTSTTSVRVRSVAIVRPGR